jgi:hypothetical protein
LGKLLSDPGACEEMGDYGRSRTLEHFDFELQVGNFLDWMHFVISVYRTLP